VRNPPRSKAVKTQKSVTPQGVEHNRVAKAKAGVRGMAGSNFASASPCHLVTVSPSPRPVPHDDPEIERMLRVQRDEPGAFAELLKRYWTPVFSRLYRQLGDRQEAEDLAQDVFLRLYRSRQRYQPRAKFTTWLFHIAQNVARNALRSRARHPCVPLG